MMLTLILKVLVGLFILQGLLKFVIHFVLPYDARINRIKSYYQNSAFMIALYDDITLALMLVLTLLLFISGQSHYLSFGAGLIVGMTLIQIYFHRFREPLPSDKAPEQPTPPVELVSYAIQANPKKAWKEYLFMTIVLLWTLCMLFF